jgi:hypothetical protein
MGGFGEQPPVGGGGGGGIPGLPPISIGSSGGGADAGAVNSALGEIEGWVGDVASWGQSYVNNLLGGLVDELQTIFADVWNWLKSLADTWLGQLVQGIWDWLKNLYEQLKCYVQEVLKWLKWYEAYEQKFWSKILNPILQVISSLRRVLLIFRIFHLKFASELDQWLANREAAIARLILWQRNEFNTLTNWLNYIINPLGLFNEGLYLQTALSSITQLWSALWAVGNQPLGAVILQEQETQAASVQYKTAQADIVTTGASGLLPADLDLTQQFAAQYQAWGYNL